MLPVGIPGLHGVNPCGVHTAVSQDICQPDDILLQRVICPGEQVPQVVGKDLALRHSGSFAQVFHLMPDVAPVQGPPASGDKHGPSGDPPLPCVPHHHLLQLSGQKNGP